MARNIGGGDSAACEILRTLPTPFLTKTYQLVDDPDIDDVISWNEDGSTFIVWNQTEFARDLLPRILVIMFSRKTSHLAYLVLLKNRAEGAENGLDFAIVRRFNGVPRVLACFSNNLLRREPLKLVDGGQSQRAFIYIKDAIEENPARANGQIFNVGNPNNEVIVRKLAEMMTQVYSKVSGEPPLETLKQDLVSERIFDMVVDVLQSEDNKVKNILTDFGDDMHSQFVEILRSLLDSYTSGSQDMHPDTELLKELPDEYTFETALADFMDNSLQAVWSNLKGEKRLIRLAYPFFEKAAYMKG